MRASSIARGFATGFALLAASGALRAADEDFHVFTEGPRLFLTKQRLRLLQRERERDSIRWQQFDALVAGGAPMPETAVAQALYYQVSESRAAGRKAVEWALGGSATDLRQLALVFDWCKSAMSDMEIHILEAKIEREIADPAASDIPHQAARALAAIAIADELKDQGESILRPIVEKWWRGGADTTAIPAGQTYKLLELIHALNDNVAVDLRESAPSLFRDLPIDLLMAHYPAPFRGPDNDFLVPVFAGEGEPDPNLAVWSRAAGLAMVALDTNSNEIQYLQGWLTQDRYILRDPLGCLYEFLWANPYQPGLSYTQLPLVFHNPATGHVFARTSWDEDATWIGYFDGHLQVFRDGKLEILRSGATTRPVRVGDAVILSAPMPETDGTIRFEGSTEVTVVLGLTPRSNYDIEIDDEELGEGATDTGGTLVVTLPPETQAGVRIRKRP